MTAPKKTTPKKPAAKPAQPDATPVKGLSSDAAPAESGPVVSTPNTPEGLAPSTTDAPPPDRAGVAPADATEVLDFNLFTSAPADFIEAPEPPTVYIVVPQSYRVISPLRHNGRRYKPGDLVTLMPAQAARLAGVVTTEPAEG